MRLVKPSIGECADRLTILELKIEFGKKRGVSVIHFEAEYGQILNYLGIDNGIRIEEAYLGLRTVNRGLWELEGRARHDKKWKENPWLAVDLLEQITALNDQRAELVNKMDGKEAKEKLY